MGLVTAPIIAITLVLLSVFVPTAFIPVLLASFISNLQWQYRYGC